jgi:hypothetical protein
MLFASASLAARIERAECRLLRDSAAAAVRRRPDGDIFTMPLAGGIATFTAPGSPLNKVAGLGFEGSLVEGELEAVEAAFAKRGVPVQMEVSSLADPSIVRLLTTRAYMLQGFENVLGLRLPAPVSVAAANGLEIASSAPEELADWLDVLVSGFASPDTQGVPSDESYPREILESVMADMASADGFSRFLARREGTVVGGGSLRLNEGAPSPRSPERVARGAPPNRGRRRMRRGRGDDRAWIQIAGERAAPGLRSPLHPGDLRADALTRASSWTPSEARRRLRA